jgi:hypothetical protein
VACDVGGRTVALAEDLVWSLHTASREQGRVSVSGGVLNKASMIRHRGSLQGAERV